MIVPHPYYRLNPSRAIHVIGQINRELVSRLTPQILKLQSATRDPITVYIDSPGGHVGSMETILRLLKLSDQDSSGPCHIITAVTIRAASAAADLLSSGDYAVAFPNSTILYHGIRQQEPNPLTFETSSMLANLLRLSNDVYAMELAKKIEDRFSFRYIITRDGFDAVRTEHGKPDMSDLDCFVEYIDKQLSLEAKNYGARFEIGTKDIETYSTLCSKKSSVISRRREQCRLRLTRSRLLSISS